MQPRAIPKEVAVFKEAELPPDVINTWRRDGRRVWRHSWTGHGRSAVAPPPPKPTAPTRIKQGGNVTGGHDHHADPTRSIRPWRGRPAFRATSFCTRSSTRTARLPSSK